MEYCSIDDVKYCSCSCSALVELNSMILRVKIMCAATCRFGQKKATAMIGIVFKL